jgi:hypothetical protein
MTRGTGTVFTTPSDAGPNGYDNVEGNLIVSLGDPITDPKGATYTVVGCLGRANSDRSFRCGTPPGTCPR